MRPLAKTYRCTNEACVLGSRVAPGLFTGGITDEQVTLLTGRPTAELKKGTDYGDGFCPNCGLKGEEHDPKAAAREAIDEQISALQAERTAL